MDWIFSGSGGAPAVLVAAGGVAVGGAAVAGTTYLRNLAASYGSEKLKRQSQVVSEALTQSLAPEGLPMPVSFDLTCVQRTSIPLQASAPAYPQIKLAFDAILSYQHNRSNKADPKTLTCELLKCWLREHAADRDVPPREVLAYRNFCRKLVERKESLRGSSFLPSGKFITAMAHVATHLGHLLHARLEQTQDASKLLEQLGGLAYHFALQSTKLLLLSATTFNLPDSLYSLDSLQELRRTAFSAELLREKYDKDRANEMLEAWQTDCGRLLRTLLEQQHCMALVTSQEGRDERTAAGAMGLVLEVQRAEALPSKYMDVVDPFVKVKVLQGKTTLSSSKTSWKEDCPNPVWNEAFFLDVPSPDSAEVNITLDIVDHNGSVMSAYTFASVAPVDLPSALVKAKRAEDVVLSLSAVAGTLSDPRDVSEARLLVRFRFPDMARELEQLRLAWPPSATDRPNSGLKFPGLGPAFLDAAETLDHATYFLDIAARRAREVTRLLGDLGAVLLAPVLCDLLDEVEQRVMASGHKAEALNEAVAMRAIESERSSHTCISAATERLSEAMKRPSKAHTERVRRETAISLEAMHKLERDILTCCSDLRRQCQRYQGISGVLSAAKRSVTALCDCLAGEETQRRSSRFAKTLADCDSYLASRAVAHAELKAGAGKDILSAALTEPGSETGKATEHAFGYPDRPVTATTQTLPGTTRTTARTSERRAGPFKQGDKVHVWSESRQMWMTDAIVLEVAASGFVVGGKPATGALRIKSAAGEKWVLPEQIPRTVRFELFPG